jgi:hypothetical protein
MFVLFGKYALYLATACHGLSFLWLWHEKGWRPFYSVLISSRTGVAIAKGNSAVP